MGVLCERYHPFDPPLREEKKEKDYFPRVNGLARCNEATPEGGIYAIRLLTKNVVRSFFLSFLII
jgi:hypothetical protein